MGSIRSRLLVSLILVELTAGLISAWVAFSNALNEFNGFLDGELKQTAEAMAARGSVHPDAVTVAGYSPEKRILIQVYESKTNALYLSDRQPALPILEKQGFSALQFNGEQWRVFTIASGSEIIEAAQPISIRTKLAATASLRILQPLLFSIPLSAILIWLLVGQGLAPLDKTARSVSRRTPSSLEPLETNGLPRELLALVNAINNLLRRLSSSLEAQKRFASDAAHELRTPLTAIKLQAQLAQRAPTPEQRNKYFSRLNDGIARATRLIEQLLTIARLDPESARRPFASVSLPRLLETVKEEMETISSQKHISISIDAQPVETFGNPDALTQMVANLTDNAIKYTQENGHILLRTFERDGMAVIQVSDDGPGISEADRKRIFERFYRALGTRVAGNGLGLAIVARIVDIHRGRIQVLDGPEGKGTTFEIVLPNRR